jgi:hypothetical protein
MTAPNLKDCPRRWRTALGPPIGLVACLVLQACGEPKSPPASTAGTFTLSTGVVLSELPSCSKDESSTAPTIEKSGAAYVVKFRGFFPCNADLSEPYLTESGGDRATLVLWNADKYRGGCECPRDITVTITGRLKQGSTLYVLNDNDVLGQLLVP